MRCPISAHVYGSEVVSRCISLVRGTKIIFLPTRCRGFGFVLELGPKKCPKSVILALCRSIFRPRWPIIKNAPKARWTPCSNTTALDTTVRVLSAAPGGVCDLARSLNMRCDHPLVRQRRSVRRTMFGCIFDDRPPWPENRSTKRQNGPFGALLGP